MEVSPALELVPAARDEVTGLLETTPVLALLELGPAAEESLAPVLDAAYEDEAGFVAPLEEAFFSVHEVDA